MRNFVTSRFAQVVALSITITSLASFTARAELKPITTVEGITEYRLDNGLQVLLFPDSSKPTVTVNITYMVGSRHEGRGETGMAHLLEHMVFKGTPDHPDIWKALEDHGARFNGSTWVDRTNYFETLPTSDPENLEWAIRMEADRMINSNIAAEDLATEFSVVRNEFEMGENSPTNVLWERMVSTAYLWHNYGKSTIGSRSDIERVPVKNLKAFYKEYYQPDNAMLVIAGDFKPDRALKLIQKYFGAIPRPDRTLDATYTVEPVQDGARHVELRRVGDVAACGTVYHICAGSHADFAALEIIQNILTAEPAGRLYKELVETGMAASIFGVAFGWAEPGIMINMAEVRKNDPVDDVLAKMIEVIEGLSTNPITDAEVKRAKNRLLKNVELALKSSSRIGVQMSESAAAGDWRLFFLNRDRTENMTPDTVRRVAAKYFKSSNRTSGVFYPTEDISRTEVPPTPNIAALLSDYEGKEALSEGEEFDATPENIERRVKRMTLGQGMKLALLSKETRGDAVRAVLNLRFGSEGDLKGRQAAAGLVPRMLMRGTKNYTYQQIQDKLDELKANVRVSGGGGMGGSDGSVNVSITTDREHLAAVIDLVGEVLKEPTFPTDEFEIVKKEALAGLEEQLSEPRSLGINNMLRRMFPWPSDDVRYVPTIAESIERLKSVNLDDVRDFHKDFFGASDATMTVIGDFDESEVTNAVKNAVAGWKSPKPFKRIESKFRGDAKGSTETIVTPDKKMAIVACGVNVKLRDDDPDYPAMHLANYILGASAKSRLLNRLRQKEGLSYGAGSQFMADSEDEFAIFLGFGICAPENAHKAHASLLDEISRTVRDGVEPDELAEAKSSFALQAKNKLANDGTVARMLNESLRVGRTLEFQKNLYDAIDKLTPAQIQRSLKKYINMERMVTVKAGDLKPESVD